MGALRAPFPPPCLFDTNTDAGDMVASVGLAYLKKEKEQNKTERERSVQSGVPKGAKNSIYQFGHRLAAPCARRNNRGFISRCPQREHASNADANKKFIKYFVGGV